MRIEPRHLRMIQKILKPYPYGFFAFGSRAKETARPFSDLDLCYFENISNRELLELEAAFEESDLPFKVDLIHFHQTDPEFQSLIIKNLKCIQNGPSQSN